MISSRFYIARKSYHVALTISAVQLLQELEAKKNQQQVMSSRFKQLQQNHNRQTAELQDQLIKVTPSGQVRNIGFFSERVYP